MVGEIGQKREGRREDGLGHRSPQSTESYAKVDERALADLERWSSGLGRDTGCEAAHA